jgi:glycosyltransferase involved in cell wall biosynthesis
VHDLSEQAERLEISYEIIVAEDGSTDTESVKTNEVAMKSLPHCRHLVRKENVGRAAIRNVLAREARYDWLLFIDSDMTVKNNDYLLRYLNAGEAMVVDGGVSIDGDAAKMGTNLRFLYEKAAEQEHTAEKRQLKPYQHLHTANLLVSREVMQKCPFDERFHHYGYEDVLLGKQLRQRRTPTLHIDNPLSFSTFEDNRSFVRKTEEGLRTLHEFREDLRGYSSLLTLVEGIHVGGVKWLLRQLFRLLKHPMRHNLCGNKPRLGIFRFYKLGYYLSIK